MMVLDQAAAAHAGRKGSSTQEMDACYLSMLSCITPLAIRCRRTVLDLWLKGSGLTSVALYVKNTASKQLSREVRFQRADQLQDGVSILSNTDDGFLHVQVDLSALRITSNSTSAAIPSAAGAASCGGPAAAAAARFDRIVIADISGMGFTLVLSEVTLLSKDTIQASDLQTPAIMATKPPVFAADLNALKAGKNRCVAAGSLRA